MKSGYLSVETHAGRPGRVRLMLSTESPDPAPAAHSPTRIRYVARFNDGEAALMHTHEILKRRLLDPDAHLYRTTAERAIAAIASLGLSHRQVYLDAQLPDETRTAIRDLTARFRGNQRRKDRLFEAFGYIGIGLLLLNLLFLSFA